MSKDLIDTRNPGANPGQFQKGHPPTTGSWKPGQHGGYRGGSQLTELRKQFEVKFYEALVAAMPPSEAVDLLCEAIRKGERWALALYINKIAPDQLKIDLTKTEQPPVFDLRQLSDSEVEAFLQLARKAATNAGESTAAGDPGDRVVEAALSE